MGYLPVIRLPRTGIHILEKQACTVRVQFCKVDSAVGGNAAEAASPNLDLVVYIGRLPARDLSRTCPGIKKAETAEDYTWLFKVGVDKTEVGAIAARLS